MFSSTTSSYSQARDFSAGAVSCAGRWQLAAAAPRAGRTPAAVGRGGAAGAGATQAGLCRQGGCQPAALSGAGGPAAAAV